MREPEEAELERERSLRAAWWLDGTYDAVLVAAAIVTGSLTMLGEAVRALLFFALLSYSFATLRAIHRGRLTRFEFGTEKLERLISATLGGALLISAAWLIGITIETLFADREAASPPDLALAAIVNAANLALNAIAWDIVRRTARDRHGESYRAQLHARWVMTACSAILQVTLTAAALAQDPLLALFFDALGAAFVAGVLVQNGLRLVADALPVLLDAQADPAVKEGLSAVAMRHLPDGAVLGLRTRQCGDAVHAEIGIDAAPGVDCDSLAAIEERMLAALGAHGRTLVLTIAPQRATPAAEASTPLAPPPERSE